MDLAINLLNDYNSKFNSHITLEEILLEDIEFLKILDEKTKEQFLKKPNANFPLPKGPFKKPRTFKNGGKRTQHYKNNKTKKMN
jgi:hypothetical protein